MSFKRIEKDRLFLGVFTGLAEVLKQKNINISVYALRIIYLLLIVLLPAVPMYLIIFAYLITGIIFPLKDK